MKIGLISDTHSYLDREILEFFEPVDEIWHAGDIGDLATARSLQEVRPLIAVHGNIDDTRIRALFPVEQVLDREGLTVFITHIGGYPGRYAPGIEKKLKVIKPGLFICGHSHILKVMPDRVNNLLFINPGAAGHAGFHAMRTLVRLEIDDGRVRDLEVVELGKRGKIKPAGNGAGLRS